MSQKQNTERAFLFVKDLEFWVWVFFTKLHDAKKGPIFQTYLYL